MNFATAWLISATVFNNANNQINVYGDDVEVDYRGYEVKLWIPIYIYYIYWFGSQMIILFTGIYDTSTVHCIYSTSKIVPNKVTVL